MTAISEYAARVDAVLAQRTRLRGPQPGGDPFAGLPADGPLFAVSPRSALSPIQRAIADFVEPGDSVLDVGGGAGRFSLPLALKAREVLNVEESEAMARAFEMNARTASILNARAVVGDWLEIDIPGADFVLVNHVSYLTREIETFLEKLRTSARRRVLLTVGSPSPPSRNHEVYQLVFGEPEEAVPGVELLVRVLWELGILPDIQVLPGLFTPPVSPSREAAIESALRLLAADQWAFWPMGEALSTHARNVVEANFGALFAETEGGLVPRWLQPNREVLITWASE